MQDWGSMIMIIAYWAIGIPIGLALTFYFTYSVIGLYLSTIIANIVIVSAIFLLLITVDYQKIILSTKRTLQREKEVLEMREQLKQRQIQKNSMRQNINDISINSGPRFYDIQQDDAEISTY